MLAVIASSTIVPPSWAQGLPKSLAGYARVAGEAGAAHSACNMALDVPALRALGAQLGLDASDGGAVEAASDVVAAAMADAHARSQAEGEAFCEDALASYGPGGSVAPGLLTKR
jgi:hypothetical protein